MRARQYRWNFEHIHKTYGKIKVIFAKEIIIFGETISIVKQILEIRDEIFISC